MNCSVIAQGSGKQIRVYDRIAGADVLNQFLDAGAMQSLVVASNDGSTAEVDVWARMTAQNPWVTLFADLTVTSADPTITVPDV